MSKLIMSLNKNSHINIFKNTIVEKKIQNSTWLWYFSLTPHSMRIGKALTRNTEWPHEPWGIKRRNLPGQASAWDSKITSWNITSVQEFSQLMGFNQAKSGHLYGEIDSFGSTLHLLNATYTSAGAGTSIAPLIFFPHFSEITHFLQLQCYCKIKQLFEHLRAQCSLGYMPFLHLCMWLKL